MLSKHAHGQLHSYTIFTGINLNKINVPCTDGAWLCLTAPLHLRLHIASVSGTTKDAEQSRLSATYVTAVTFEQCTASFKTASL